MPSAFNLGQGTVIRFQGNDRCRVFNNLCTQDLRKLGSGQAVETFVTDVKGRTLGHGIAFALNNAASKDAAYFVTVPNQGGKLVQHFDRYIIREDAIISDLSDSFRFCLFENRSVATLACSTSLEQVPIAKCACSLEVDGRSIVLVHATWIGAESVLALLPMDFSDQNMRERLGSDWVDSDMVARSEWELLRIQAHWPWYGRDMDDRNLPQEVDRNDMAISFNKGCYLGQETIARLDALGQVQKKLVRLLVESNTLPKPQSVVQGDGKEVGTICTAALDPAKGACVALAYVKRRHFKKGQIVSVNGDDAVVM